MFESARTSDTLAVLRGVGPRTLGGAVVRRAAAFARRLGRAASAWKRPETAAASPWWAAALRSAPSPLAAAPLVDRELVRKRARAALSTADATPAVDDPRLAWEPGRGGRLLHIAAGLAVEPEAHELRRGFERLLLEWLEGHRAVHGSDPLEAALRAWALWNSASLAGIHRFSPPALAAAARSFVEHARHIRDRLEDRGLVVGSHLLGELVGLYACGAALRAGGAEPAEWRRVASAGIAQAAEQQLLEDGAGAEGSTGYTRFVAELFVASLACARAVGEEPPAGAGRAARLAFRWLLATMTPDGGDLGIGDDDASRVLIGPRDARDLASLAAMGAWWSAPRLERTTRSEDAGWLVERELLLRWEAQPPVAPAARFESFDFGLYLARRGGLGGDLVALRAGPHGQSGAGGHAHNDALSIAVWLDGAPAIIDPGTGVYLGRPALRDRFRGVAAHAGVSVDGREPSPLLATRPFALPDRANARVLEIADRDGVWRCHAVHDGYRHVGVTHRREVLWDRRAGEIVLRDTLDGSGAHQVAVGFPLAAPSARASGDSVDAGAFGLAAGDGLPVGWRVDPGLASPRYGDIVPAVVARRLGRVELPVTLRTVIRARDKMRSEQT